MIFHCKVMEYTILTFLFSINYIEMDSANKKVAHKYIVRHFLKGFLYYLILCCNMIRVGSSTLARGNQRPLIICKYTP